MSRGGRGEEDRGRRTTERGGKVKKEKEESEREKREKVAGL